MAWYFTAWLIPCCLPLSFPPSSPADGTQRPAALWSRVHRWASTQLNWLFPRQRARHGQHQRGCRGLRGLLLRPINGLLPIGFKHRQSIWTPIQTHRTWTVACPWTCILTPPYISHQDGGYFWTKPCNDSASAINLHVYLPWSLLLLNAFKKTCYKRIPAIIKWLNGVVILHLTLIYQRTNSSTTTDTNALQPSIAHLLPISGGPLHIAQAA